MLNSQDIMSALDGRGIAFLGCGRMGFALLSGVLDYGVPLDSLSVTDPHPGGHLLAMAEGGLVLNAAPATPPAICLIAVKPQSMSSALPQIAHYGGGNTLMVSVAAGVTLETLATHFAPGTPIIRAMPNTPAAVGSGISALIANEACRPRDKWNAETLMSTVGTCVWLDDEADMDAVTAVSGSGPAYVFYMIECMAAAGVAEGLKPELAAQLALATVSGAGKLADDSSDPPSVLRENVTSPGGTTAAALAVLMDGKAGLAPLLEAGVAAAAARSRELRQGS